MLYDDYTARCDVETSPDVVNWTRSTAHARCWRHSSISCLSQPRWIHAPSLHGLLQRSAERHLNVPPSTQLCSAICSACSGIEMETTLNLRFTLCIASSYILIILQIRITTKTFCPYMLANVKKWLRLMTNLRMTLLQFSLHFRYQGPQGRIQDLSRETDHGEGRARTYNGVAYGAEPPTVSKGSVPGGGQRVCWKSLVHFHTKGGQKFRI